MRSRFNLRFIKLNTSEIFLVIALITLLLAPALNLVVSVNNYLDEIIALIMVFLLIKNLPRVLKNNKIMEVLGLLILLILLGLISNATAGLISNIFPIVIDAFGLVKNHIIFLGIVFFIPVHKKERILRFILPLMQLFVVVSFICACINLIVQTPWNYDIRYGIRSFQFFFQNPASLGQVMIIALAIFENEDYKGICNFFAMAVMIMTLRAGIIAIFFVYIIVMIIFKYSSKIKWYHIAILSAVSILVAWNMIQTYFISANTHRYRLLEYGILVFKRYFPLGSGFATYGSQMSYNYYSSLYYEFGFNNMWGFNQAYGGIINDNYWPMVMAQIGFIGVIVNLFLFYKEFKIVSWYPRKLINKRMALVLFINMMISTTASANMTSVAGTLMYFVMGLLLCDRPINFRKRIKLEKVRK